MSFIFNWAKIQMPTRDFREIFSVETILDFQPSADFRKSVCRQRVVAALGSFGIRKIYRTLQQPRSTYVDHTNTIDQLLLVWSTKSRADVKQCV